MLEDLLCRNKGSMTSLLRITDIPQMTVPPEEIEKLQEAREKALPGECRLVSAVQDGDDATTRQELPMWMAKPVERFVFKWADECRKWKTLALERSRKGKEFTQRQQKMYDEFVQSGCVCKLLYDRQAKSVIWKLQTTTGLKDISKQYFSIQVSILSVGQKIDIQAANGEPKSLVLLKGHPQEGADVMPEGLDSGLDAEVVALAEAGSLEQGEDAGEEDEAIAMDAEEQLLEEEEIFMQEVCCNTSDEEEVSKLFEPGEKFTKVKAFCYRDEYKKLQDKGLTMLPTHIPGVFLSFHKGTRTWQGFFPGVSSCGFTFGGTTNRSSARFGPYTYLFGGHGSWNWWCFLN